MGDYYYYRRTSVLAPTPQIVVALVCGCERK